MFDPVGVLDGAFPGLALGAGVSELPIDAAALGVDPARVGSAEPLIAGDGSPETAAEFSRGADGNAPLAGAVMPLVPIARAVGGALATIVESTPVDPPDDVSPVTILRSEKITPPAAAPMPR